MNARIAPELRGTALGAALAASDRLLEGDARFVKNHRRTAVAAMTLEGREIFVKQFKPYAWYRRLEWLFAPTPARRCWRQSTALEQAGFGVAPALAFVEIRSFGLPADCYFVTASLDGAEPAGRFWREQAVELPSRVRRRLLLALARELRRFHDAGFYSGDANADNFLVRLCEPDEAKFFLLDLENMRRFRHVSRRRRIKNLVQLHRPVRGEIGRMDRLRFLRAYAGRPLSDLRDWLTAIESLDAKKEAEYQARHQISRE